MIGYIRHHWSQSTAFRVVLILAVTYAGLRLFVHGAYLSVLLAPNSATSEGLPGWAETEGPMLPVDLQVYLDAAERFEKREDLYVRGRVTRLEDLYQYTPAFAMVSRVFLRLSPAALAAIHTLLHLVAYVLLYVLWDRVFKQSALPAARRTLAYAIPLWLMFPDFWSDLGYLNIYVFMALLSTLLIESILAERVFWSALWLSLILQTKPQWAAVAALPALLGRWRFTIKSAGLALGLYTASAALTVLASNPTYAVKQWVGYARFLTQLSGHFPWRLPGDGFLGYNHSVKQIVFFLLGVAPGAARFATVAKGLLLAPLGAIGVRHLIEPVQREGHEVPELSLNLAFALYLAAFIWLDMVWELTLGIALFVYLVASADGIRRRRLLWAAFLPYALVDVFRLTGAALAFVGLNTVLPGPYVLTDPSVHVPMVMILILVFYALLVRRLWLEQRTPRLMKGV